MYFSSKGWQGIPASGPFIFKGTWDANTNTPTLASGTGTKGDWYLVSVAGSTNLDGITDWEIGDNAIFNGTTWNKVDNTDGTTISHLSFTVDGNGFAITTGIKGDLIVPFACNITGYTIVADQTGSIQIDLWKDTYANFPPTDADSITASAPVAISASDKGQDTTLTGWNTTLAAGDIIRVNVDSAATIERVSVILNITRT